MPITKLAYIEEESCIGCTKCIDVCPVDAILGSEQFMHTVIQQECIGCELCVPACPIDCISLIPLPKTYQEISKEHIKRRSLARQNRQKLAATSELIPLAMHDQQKKQYIKDAILRVKTRNK
ncbi:MAG: hypothetical protein A3F43_06055 [Gammaproteobacteria bacterium RIFCSPHIGHO2_12_FULL_42_10]|nr:MAG: hypothetical protein A3F43_06055 [Gammaproteobacteria bacterium RIFCSPHIGHO2_12_FULL_42_10]